jgi:L-ascorbate metabolism protein UlaG (beta-lactamase superfamily)
MNQPVQSRITFHEHTFFELSIPGRTLFIDPVFSQTRRGRKVPGQVRGADYVLLTSATPWLDDALDVLDSCEATVVTSARLCRQISRELELDRKRELDLEPWERASEDGLRITAVPITASLGMEGSIEEGASILRDMTNVFPQSRSRLPLLGAVNPLLQAGSQLGSRAMGMFNSASQMRSLDRVNDMLGLDVTSIARGRSGVGFFFEVEGHPSVLHLADGVHAGTSDDELEDIADVCQPKILIMQADGTELEPVVRAARVLQPATVLLYRARDPYAQGRKGQVLPMGQFLAAIEEGAPKCETLHLRKGDSFVLDKDPSAKSASAAPSAAPRSPAASPPVVK